MAIMYPTDIENYTYTPSEKEIYTCGSILIGEKL